MTETTPNEIVSPLLTRIEAARLLSISTSLLDRWTKSKKVPGVVKLSRLVRYDRATLERWIADGCEEVTRWEKRHQQKRK